MVPCFAVQRAVDLVLAAVLAPLPPGTSKLLQHAEATASTPKNVSPNPPSGAPARVALLSRSQSCVGHARPGSQRSFARASLAPTAVRRREGSHWGTPFRGPTAGSGSRREPDEGGAPTIKRRPEAERTCAMRGPNLRMVTGCDRYAGLGCLAMRGRLPVDGVGTAHVARLDQRTRSCGRVGVRDRAPGSPRPRLRRLRLRHRRHERARTLPALRLLGLGFHLLAAFHPRVTHTPVDTDAPPMAAQTTYSNYCDVPLRVVEVPRADDAAVSGMRLRGERRRPGLAQGALSAAAQELWSSATSLQIEVLPSRKEPGARE